MSAYEDPDAMAAALEAAANAAESEGCDYQEVGLVLLRAAARLLRKQADEGGIVEPDDLPTVADLVGSDPGFADLPADEYVQQLRGGIVGRPPYPDHEIPDGWKWEAVVEDSKWRVRQTGRCRCIDHDTRCPAPGVAQINRSRNAHRTPPGEQWWSYCADHLYGRWIEDDKVMVWRSVRTQPEQSA